MSTGIFIKTWKADIPWIKYALASIAKYGSDIDDIVIVSDESCVDEVRAITDIRVESVPDWKNGYIQQQWVKLNADNYLDTEHVLYVDSDCVFHTPFSPSNFIEDNKPILMKTMYGNLGGGEVWKGITEGIVGWDLQYEYMRRLPWMYRTNSLYSFRHYFSGLRTTLENMTNRAFSEFNALGAFIDRFESDRYFITDTEVWMPPSVAKQFWSWGGITPEIKTEIEGMLK